MRRIVFLLRNMCFLHVLTSYSIKSWSTKCPESDFLLSRCRLRHDQEVRNFCRRMQRRYMPVYAYVAEFVVFNVPKLMEAMTTVKSVRFGGKGSASGCCWGVEGTGGQEAR